METPSTVTDSAGWGLGFKQFLTNGAECINTAQGGRSSTETGLASRSATDHSGFARGFRLSSELVAGVQFLRGLVAHLHVVDTGCAIGGIDRLDEIVVEFVIVHEPAVADGAIEHLDFGPVGNPALDGVFPPSAKKANCKVYFSPLAATLVASTLAAAFAALKPLRLAIVFMQPVSERGPAGIEELESQTVNLLSFQPISRSSEGARMLRTAAQKDGFVLAHQLVNGDVYADMRIGNELHALGFKTRRQFSIRTLIESLQVQRQPNRMGFLAETAPPGETCGSARWPRNARLRFEPRGVATMRKGAAVFCVRRTASDNWASCSAARPLSPASSSVRYCGTASSPSQFARRCGASIRPSTRTSRGSAGLSSTIRPSRRAWRCAVSARRALPRAQMIVHMAATSQAASSSSDAGVSG